MKIEGKVIAIRLQNFMGFADTKWIELRPITLMYGWNSSGKSAIIRALLLLRQSLDPGREELLSFVADNGIDLGSFWRMVRGKNYYDREPPTKDKTPAERARLEDGYDPGELRQMVFGFRCEVSRGLLKDLDVIIPNDDESFIDLYLNFQWNKPGEEIDGKVELSAVTLEAPRSKDPDHSEDKLILQAEWTQLKNTNGWYLVSHFFDFKRLYYPHDRNVAAQLQTWNPYFAFNSGSGFLPEFNAVGRSEQDEKSDKGMSAITKIENIFRDCCASVRSLFRDDKFRYLGPIRFAPKRTYLLSELSGHRWDNSGQIVIRDFLNSYQENSVRQDEFNTWLHALGIGEKLQVKQLWLGVHNDLPAEAFQLEIQEAIPVNIRDVGYGVSQVLPVLLQIFNAPDDSLVIIEQPELHMHPEAQSILADFFINQSIGGRRFFIETHSEHVQLRLQLRAIKGVPISLTSIKKEPDRDSELKGKEISINRDHIHFLFVTRNTESGTSILRSVEIDPRGNLKDAPAAFVSFFSRSLLDSSVISIFSEKHPAESAKEGQ